MIEVLFIGALVITIIIIGILNDSKLNAKKKRLQETISARFDTLMELIENENYLDQNTDNDDIEEQADEVDYNKYIANEDEAIIESMVKYKIKDRIREMHDKINKDITWSI